jgi:SPP1 gp7 family putative phage head morphogenesis protein
LSQKQNKKIRLTRKRKKWVDQRKPVVMRGSRLNYNVGVQSRYVLTLRKLVTRMANTVNREIMKLFESTEAKEYRKKVVAAQDASIASQARILTNSLTKRFDQLFGREAKTIAENMVKSSSRASSTKLNSSLKQLSGGVALKTNILTGPLKEVVKASVSENVNLITSISDKYLSQVEQSVMRSITTGAGTGSLISDLEKYYGKADRRARDVALDQTRKVYNSINKGRMQAVGVKKFEWVHSGGGQKPRESHIAMSGNIYSFDDLPIINQEQVDRGYEAPERGIPGQAIKCRCTMVPVIEFEQEEQGDENSTE